MGTHCSDGGERTNFLASATYNKNNGIFKDEDYERYSIRLNLNHEINKYVKIGAQTQYSHTIQQRGAGLAGGWRLSPLAQLWDENGEIIPLPGSYNVYNTMIDLVPGAVDRPLKTTRYLGSYSLDIKLPVDGLKFRSNLGIDARTVQDYEFRSAETSNRGHGYFIRKERSGQIHDVYIGKYAFLRLPVDGFRSL